MYNNNYMEKKKKKALEVLELLDLTSLNKNDTNKTIEELCVKASMFDTKCAAVCVYPKFIKVARRKLKELGNDITKVATVVNFPHGKSNFEDISKEIIFAIKSGVDEIDLVYPHSAIVHIKNDIANLKNDMIKNDMLKEKPHDEEFKTMYRLIFNEEIEESEENIPQDVIDELIHTSFKNVIAEFIINVSDICDEANVILKVIIESGILEQEKLIKEVSRISLESGADFIKTSTGQVKHANATLEAAEHILTTIRELGLEDHRGFKASGGITTVDYAYEYIRLAKKICGEFYIEPDTFRFGSSSLFSNIKEILEDKTGSNDNY